MDLAALITEAKFERFTSGYEATDAEALGLLVAGHFSWDGVAIMKTAAFALEDANFHTESGAVMEMAKTIETVNDDAPYTDSMRKALFAKLSDVYGSWLDRSDRLAKLSVLTGRRVTSMSTTIAEPLTRGEFGRVMSILSTLEG